MPAIGEQPLHGSNSISAMILKDLNELKSSVV
jgi:hypothetical protein